MDKQNKKLVKYLLGLIKHDFGFYNPIWKWSDLPSPLKESYHSVEAKLKEWQSKGYLRLFEENGQKMIEIISVPEY